MQHNPTWSWRCCECHICCQTSSLQWQKFYYSVGLENWTGSSCIDQSPFYPYNSGNPLDPPSEPNSTCSSHPATSKFKPVSEIIQIENVLSFYLFYLLVSTGGGPILLFAAAFESFFQTIDGLHLTSQQLVAWTCQTLGGINRPKLLVGTHRVNVVCSGPSRRKVDVCILGSRRGLLCCFCCSQT